MAVMGATLAVFVAVLIVARGASQRDLTLLFGGLDLSAAGDVITSLESRGVVYEVRGNAIYVDAAMRDSLRMSLAGEGLPLVGGQGYELLDNMSGFGTTSQMFDTAYMRAREGELARTILASPAVRTARVHISTPKLRGFSRNNSPTAAVTVSLTRGGLSGEQIQAFQYLVSAAVSGMSPDDVAIIDDASGLISNAKDGQILSRANGKADMLRNRAERLLAARVGPGNAVVEVTVDAVSESEQITERLIDPDSRVAISTDVTENGAKSNDTRGGDVSVASNLPDGAAAENSGSSSNENTETRALTNYEISLTERQVVRAPGDIKRLTVAVLINELQVVSDDGTATSTPRNAQELADLEQLVASAVGLNEERGDVLTLRSLPFEPDLAQGTPAIPVGIMNQPLNVMQLIQIAVAAIVALLLGFFVVRPVLLNTRKERTPNTMLAPSELMPPDGAQMATIGNADPRGQALEVMPQPADAVDRLRQMITERETETVQILQDWMEAPNLTEKA